jgi:hypothetical protein
MNSAMRFNDSSSAASRLQVNKAIYNHCVVDGNISKKTKTTYPIPADFKTSLCIEKSIFAKPIDEYSEATFRKDLVDHIIPMLVRAEVRSKQIFKLICESTNTHTVRLIRPVIIPSFMGKKR